MGMSSGGNKGGQLSEINITPLVDVVLVLLIIFMVVAPMLNASIDIRIPEQVEDDIPVEAQPDTKQIVLQVVREGDQNVIKLNDEPIPQAELGERLRRAYANRRDKIVFFDAKDEVTYGAAVEIMDIVRDEGLILGVVPKAIQSN